MRHISSKAGAERGTGKWQPEVTSGRPYEHFLTVVS